MKLEQQICTVEQSKRLIELGIESLSVYSYVFDNGMKWQIQPLGYFYMDDENDYYPAFTVAELGAMLPSGHWLYNKKGCEYKCYKYGDGRFCAVIISGIEELCKFVAPTEAQSRSALLIHLLENNLLTAEEANKRLAE